MHRRLALGISAIAVASAVVAGTIVGGATPAGATTIPARVGGTAAAAAAPAAGLQDIGLASTVALAGCSGSLVRYPTSLDTDRALMLTNGHCYEGGMVPAGKVLLNVPSTKTGQVLDAEGTVVGTVQADTVLYATMTDTDVTLYQLTETFGAIRDRLSATALTISASHPTAGASIRIPSGFWKRVWRCQIDRFVPGLREGQWTWRDSIRYDEWCKTVPGSSGSPIVDSATGTLIGIHNTGNNDGAMCTFNNPCEVDENGNTTVRKGQKYGQETYWFNTCLSPSNAIDLSVPGCRLPKPQAGAHR